MKNTLIALFFVFLSYPAHALTAQLLTPSGLTKVASGVREKKVALFWVDVYEMQIFVSKAEAIEKTNSEAMLTSLLKNQPVALALTFLRDVEAKKIVAAFRDSLEENKIDFKQEPFKNFLDGVEKSGEAKKASTLWFTLATKDGKESLTFSADGKENVTVSAAPELKLLKNFLSIWFGKLGDSGLEKLNAQLLK